MKFLVKALVFLSADRIRTLFNCAAMIAAATASSAAHAVFIQYELVPLGGSSYRYVYSIENNGSLGAGVAISLFDVMFDPVLYDESSLNISTLAPLSNDWDQIFLTSAPGDPATYDALALAGGVADGATVGGFSVEFTWLGAGTPGNQSFAIYDPDSFNLLETGMTGNLATVPLPAALWLFGSGALTLLGFGHTCKRFAPDTIQRRKLTELWRVES
jgi:hypothetical protein